MPPRLRRLVLERAEGNPFFVEELLGTLIDRGVIERSGDTWLVHEPPADFVVPDTLQSVLAARVDLLEPADKETLQAAAVVGRTFWAGPVGELVAEHEVDFGRLEERDFIRRSPSSSIAGEHEFTFKHALTREVAHTTIPKAKRARLHAAVAGWLEEIGDISERHAPLLAHHYAESVRPEDVDLAWSGDHAEAERLRAMARKWLARAAELARGR
jgi:predicted ATPase